MRTRTALAAVLVAWLATGSTAAAQVFTGRIDITVVDSTGAILPGANVTLAGPQSTESPADARGEVHFLNLPPGTYTVTAMLDGFADYKNEAVVVGTGVSVPLKVTMGVKGLATQVEVLAETPVIDVKKQTTTTNVTLAELQNIPNARDPWVVMQTVPSVMVDRVNVGGSESGQQSLFTAKGANFSEATWNLDGVPVTDMVATGATSTYFDFDAFQEISVTTGGADVQSATPGVRLDFVMKTGTNTPHGNARVYFENEDLQANNMPADLAATIGGASGKGNRTEQYADYGFDLGGPIMRDKWWAWGAYGKTDVRIRTLTDVLDRTVLENYAFKSQAQISEALRGGFTYFRGDKKKFGRGASATRPEETTYNQTGPTNMYKGEVSYVAGQNLFLTGRFAWVDMGFTLEPRGGLAAGKEPYVDDGGVWHNSHLFFSTTRPQRNVNIDGNYFRGRHEVKFGYAWRKFPDDSVTQWPGSKIITYWDGYPDLFVKVARESRIKADARYQDVYVSDTITMDRMTLILGARWDRQTSSLLSTTVPGVPGFDLLPSVTSQEVKNAVVYNTFLPRLGLTYSLDENRKTQARASYSMFASQLPAADAGFVATTLYNYIYYLGVDTNGDRTAQLNEILFDAGLQGYYNIDPSDPTKLQSVNRFSDVKAPLTHEFLVGMDHELMPNFAVSASFTWRNMTRQRWRPLIGVTSANYRQTGSLTGNEPETGAYNVPFYAVDPAAIEDTAGGREAVNREGYHQRYYGFEISATKRMSNRWMARLGFSTNNHTEHFTDRSLSVQDPTVTPSPGTNNTGGPLLDGGPVVFQTGGSGKSQIYLIAPKYQFVANGLYQLRWGINVGGNYVMRQGYGQPWFQDRVAAGDPLGRKTVLLISDVGEDRLPTVHSFDFRLGKAFNMRRATLNLDFDVFNLSNNATVLGRQYNHRFARNAPGGTGFGNTLEIMNPRIARIGLRVNF
jgi:hypothetical protein